MLKVGTMFSGIGAPECAWRHLGWRFRWCAEIEKFPSAVYRHHFPNVPNLGDVTKADWNAIEPVDILAFGSPCQSFSVAGKRLGLDDPRGNLALFALRVARQLRPRWVVFENVPGLLSSDGWRDFGAFLGLLGECGYGFAYRVLDAQHFGVPQRRRRVFVVGHLGDWRRAAAVLFERESLSGHHPASREAGQGVARPIAAGSRDGSGYRNDADTADNLIARCLNAKGGSGRIDGESETFVAAPLTASFAKHHGASGGKDSYPHNLVTHSLRADGCDASEDGTGRGTPLTLAIRGRGDSHDLEWRQDGTANAVLTPNGGRAGIGVGAIAFSAKDHGTDASDLAPTLRAGGHAKSHANAGVMPAVAFAQNSRDELREMNVTGALSAEPGMKQQSYARQGMSVRRLTPRECERLQGFPDDFTLIPYRGKPAADGPRYKALGNSMAVPVVRWIGERIAIAESLRAAA